MATINFGEWLPDQPGVTGAVTEAVNCYPVTSGYAPFKGESNLSDAAGADLLLSFSAKLGSVTTIFAGSASNLYKFDAGDLDLDPLTTTGYSAIEYWDATQYGGKVIAANGADKLQAYELGVSTYFADLAAAAPAAKYVTVVRDFVVAANVTAEENKVYWSDINDETDWSSGGASQSDFQDIPDGGDIQGITGGEFGLVLLEKSIVRMSYVGSPLYFQFDTISREIGCYEPGSVCQYGNMTFFLSDDGFYMCDGQRVTPIGAEKVDRWFWDDLEPAYNNFSSAVDPIKKVVIWCYQNTTGGNSLLIYNWQLGRWSYGATAASYIASAATSSTSLEGLDSFSASLDALTVSLDSRQWLGGKLIFAGASGARIVTFEGSPMSAFIETGDLSASASLITLARPQIDNGSATVSVASREMLDDTITYSTAVAASNENRVSLRSSGKYHRIKVVPTGNWTTMAGVDVNIVGRGRR
jgi:hypothetical protein